MGGLVCTHRALAVYSVALAASVVSADPGAAAHSFPASSSSYIPFQEQAERIQGRSSAEERREPPERCRGASLAPALEKVRPAAPFCGGSPGLRLAAARNEYESFQVVVNGPATVAAVQVRMQQAGGVGAPPEVRLHRVAYINVRQPSDCDGGIGRWPDPLIPSHDEVTGEQRAAFPAHVASGENVAFLVDLFIPPDCRAGDWEAQVHVHFVGASQQQPPLALQLRVFDFRLPSTSSRYRTAYGLGYEGILMAAYGKDWRRMAGNATELAQRYVDVGLEHRISFFHGLPDPVLAMAGDPSRKDLEAFGRRWADHFVRGRDLAFGLQGTRLTSVEIPIRYVRNGSAADWERFARFQADLWDVAKAQGWADLLIYGKVCDEPHDEASWKACSDTCRALRRAAPHARCAVTGAIEDARRYGALQDVDLFMPLVNFMENSEEHCSDYPVWSFRNTRSDYDAWLAGDAMRELWWYQSCMSDGCSAGIDQSDGCDHSPEHWPCRSGWPSLMVDAPAIMNRIMPVLAYLYDVAGELYWHVNYADGCTRDATEVSCPKGSLPSGQWSMDAWEDLLVQGGNGDGTLLYAGHPSRIGGKTFAPVPSLRLKQIRDGLEDFEYLAALEELSPGGREAALRFVRRVAWSAFNYTRNITLFAEVREAIGAEVERLSRERGAAAWV